VFHDYMRPAVRLACLMKQQVIYVYTHDSIFLGEDGPTHQPVSTTLALRCLPGMQVIRPADAYETVEAWKAALTYTEGPTALILSRQGLKIMDHKADGAQRGGYVASDCDGSPQICFLATGSEVGTAIGAQELLANDGIPSRVVSLPCREEFWRQDLCYRDEVLPPGVPRVSVEAGLTLGWDRYVGDTGACVGIDHYGASAPASVLAEKFGFTPENVARVAKELL
ncbi:MAG: transketolase, partial [Proteobacteria bacterium]|nr:transketolase [Pseudomonadota bacterium]